MFEGDGLSMTARAAEANDLPGRPARPQLSTDYLNRYAEALMLIEMIPMDPGVIADLHGWRAMGYREHFLVSPLRCAAAALAAYDQLEPRQLKALDDLCITMNRLIATATALLAELGESQDTIHVVEVAGSALRGLIGRTTAFINSNGAHAISEAETRAVQDRIDALFRR